MAKKKKNVTKQGTAPISPEKYIRQRARLLPIYKCYMPQEVSHRGMSEVIVARLRPNGNILFGCYLLDTYCLGVKNVMYHHDYAPEEFDQFVEKVFANFDGYIECPYEDAHNLIYSALEFADEAGIDPHPDFTNVAEYILEEDTDDIPLKEYPMGHDGKYLLIEGPSHIERRYVKMLSERLGDRFEYILDAGGTGRDYGDLDEKTAYDDTYYDDEDMASDEDILEKIFAGEDPVFNKMIEVSENIRKNNNKTEHSDNADTSEHK